MSRESNNQKHINPTMLESNNETKPTESIKRDSIQETSISTESNKLESKKPNDTKNKDNIKLDSNGDEIIWESKRNAFGILSLCIFLFANIFFWCMSWLMIANHQYFIGIVSLSATSVLLFMYGKELTFKKAFLTKYGLIIYTIFNTKSYQYGDFVMKQSINRGIFLPMIDIVEVKISSTLYEAQYFIFPYGYNEWVSFDNTDFRHLCTEYTQNALESMDTKSRVDLFLKYYEHIEIISNEERNHNIFTIDFSPYMDEMKQYYQNNIKKDS